MKVLYLPRNTKGRDFVVGDLHGCFDDLEVAMAEVGFDSRRDRLFSVGDMIDRGPDSERVFEYLPQPWFHAVAGNHETMAVEAFDAYRENPIDVFERIRRTQAVMADGDLSNPRVEMDYMLLQQITQHWRNGGEWLIDYQASRGANAAFERLRSLPLAIQVGEGKEAFGIVHADLANASWKSVCRYLEEGHSGVVETALWGRRRARRLAQDLKEGRRPNATDRVCTISGIARVFVGHTHFFDGPHERGNVCFTDTGLGYLDGTCRLVEA